MRSNSFKMHNNYIFSNKLLIFLILNTYLLSQTTTTTNVGILTEAALANDDTITTTPTTTSEILYAAIDKNVTTMSPKRLPPPPRVILNKCCHFNEYLNENKECSPGSTELWIPLIYLINRRTFHKPKGTTPRHMSFEENMVPKNCQRTDMELFMGSSKFSIFSNGSLFLSEHAKLIEPQHFCVDTNAALVCTPNEQHNNNNNNNNSTVKQLQLRKCCGQGASYDAELKTCIFGAQHAQTLTLPAPHSENIVHKTIYGFPNCPQASLAQSYAIVADVQAARMNAETGDLLVIGKNLTVDEYCLEHLHKNNVVKIFTCLHHFRLPEMTPITSSLDHVQTAMLNAGLVISVIFLAATLIAGYMMPSAHHLLHWRCQIYYVFCLFVGDSLLAYTQLNSSVELGSPVCLLLASAMHFFFLSSFFWLNTMCFNIWWTFRDFRPTSLERNQELIRLRLYSAYAWGIPLLIALIAFFIDRLEDTSLLQPGFGLRACWFNGQQASIFAYFFGPVGILLCINIILFISTTHMLTCGLWKRDDIKSTTEKTALGKVCLKLVVVMGVTWIADIISWLVGGPNTTWFFTDLINALQGVFIFVVIGCQPHVWTAFKRCCWSRSRHEITNTTNGVQHSSSSQGLPSMAGYGGELTQNTSMNTSAHNTNTMKTDVGSSPTQTKIPMETVC